MKKLIISIFFLFSFNGMAKNCSEKQRKELLKKDTLVEVCVSSNHIMQKSEKDQVVIIRNEIQGRGIGIEVYSLKKGKYELVFEDFGLGQALGSFIMKDHKNHFFIKDINGDGLKEIGLNVLNERTSLFFLYRYNQQSKKFENVKFNRKIDKNFKALDRLVGTLDHPIKVLKNSIQVFYEKDKFMTYELKNGAYFQE